MKKTIMNLWNKTEVKLRNSSIFSKIIYTNSNKGTKKFFFPGCSLTANDPSLVAETWEYLQKFGEIGLWSACCGRPLSKFVGKGSNGSTLESLQEQLIANGCSEFDAIEIIVACGNCKGEVAQLEKYFPNIKVSFLYDYMAKDKDLKNKKSDTEFIVHHPCSSRADKSLRKSFETLTNNKSISLKETKGHALSCCLVKTPPAKEKIQSVKGESVLTYCAHCTQNFQSEVQMTHVLQFWFGSKKKWNKLSKISHFKNYWKLFRIIK